jgi:hypothetical protein
MEEREQHAAAAGCQQQQRLLLLWRWVAAQQKRSVPCTWLHSKA